MILINYGANCMGFYGLLWADFYGLELLSAAAGNEFTGNGHLGLLPAAMSEIVVLSQNVMLATDL